MSGIKIRVFVLFWVLLSGLTFGQGLNSDLSKIGSLAGKAYIAPLVNNIGVNLNTGWMNVAPDREEFGFDIEFGIIGMYSGFDAAGKESFSVDGTYRFTRSQLNEITAGVTDAAIRNNVINQLLTREMPVRIYGATIAGTSDNTVNVVFGPNGPEVLQVEGPIPVTVTLPTTNVDLGVGGFLYGYKQIPGAAPQLKIGTVYGTRAIFRIVPEVKVDDSLGTFSYFGFGLEHNVSYWLESLTGTMPLDITVGFLTQTAKLDESSSFTVSSYGLNASYKYGLLDWISVTPYAGFMLETTKLSVNVSRQVDTPNGQETATIAFDVEGENKSRFVLGANFGMGFFSLNLEYAAAKSNALSAGLMFNF